MLSAVDEGIGNLTQVLADLGYLNDTEGNTIIVLTSDNGGPVNGVGDAIGSSNFPLRGGKESVWEGGVRMTGMIYGTNDVIPKENIKANYSSYHKERAQLLFIALIVNGQYKMRFLTGNNIRDYSSVFHYQFL